MTLQTPGVGEQWERDGLIREVISINTANPYNLKIKWKRPYTNIQNVSSISVWNKWVRKAIQVDPKKTLLKHFPAMPKRYDSLEGQIKDLVLIAAKAGMVNAVEFLSDF